MDLTHWMTWVTDGWEWAAASRWLLPAVLSGWAVGITAAAVRLWRRQKRLRRRLEAIFRGGTSENLETLITSLSQELESQSGELQTLERRIASLERRQEQGLNYAGLVRYDAFDDTGGEQSFSLALINEERDGLVISSLFGRSENRLYAKPLRDGTSPHLLSDEERRAVTKALQAAGKQERAGASVNYK